LVADVGCGGGNMMESLIEIVRPEKCFGVDLSDESLELVGRRLGKFSNVALRKGGFNHLPFEDGELDLVTCTEVLEHLHPDIFEKAFLEVARVLKPGGHFLATLPINERMVVIGCPNCQTVFTPYQHMMFEISEAELGCELQAKGLNFVALYQAIDRTLSPRLIKRVLKSIIISAAPNLAARLFPRAGATGFLAIKGSR
jgi:ubiquinone/menaquinone biosynthesis C-methylase UbiE